MTMFNGKLLNLLNNQRDPKGMMDAEALTMAVHHERLVTKAAGLIGLRLRGNRYGLGVR